MIKNLKEILNDDFDIGIELLNKAEEVYFMEEIITTITILWQKAINCYILFEIISDYGRDVAALI